MADQPMLRKIDWPSHERLDRYQHRAGGPGAQADAPPLTNGVAGLAPAVSPSRLLQVILELWAAKMIAHLGNYEVKVAKLQGAPPTPMPASCSLSPTVT